MNESFLNNENIEFANQLAWKFGRSILGDVHEKSITMDDLRQESFLGLYEAAQRYDPALGVEFTSLAYIWCRKFVLRAVRKYGTPLSVPYNYEGDDAELLHLDTTFDVVASPYAWHDDNGTLEDRLFYRKAQAEEAEHDAEVVLKERVERALAGLTPKERKALACIFGLDGQEKELSGQEVAQVLDVVPGRVTQIKERALHKLEFMFEN